MGTDRFDHVFVEPASYDASVAFYRDVLGWAERFSWGNAGEPRGICLASAAGMDLDARYAQLAGAALFAPEATHWGTRWFVARDPDGNLIAFEQRA
jgi:catechol 2,3-dioxygenase-like lactoylglutathione lyase family enzyme